jgi:nitric oxide reductase subunit B
MWYARSADFLQLPILQTLRWLRIVGDTMFLAGVLALVWFLLGLWTGWSYEKQPAKAKDWSDATVPSVAGD